VTKIYFPRLIMPLSTVGVGLFDLVIASGLLAIMAAGYGVYPAWSWLLLPVVVAFLAIAASGVGRAARGSGRGPARFQIRADIRRAVVDVSPRPACTCRTRGLSDDAKTVAAAETPHTALIAAFRQAALGGEIDVYSFGVVGGCGRAARGVRRDVLSAASSAPSRTTFSRLRLRSLFL